MPPRKYPPGLTAYQKLKLWLQANPEKAKVYLAERAEYSRQRYRRLVAEDPEGTAKAHREQSRRWLAAHPEKRAAACELTRLWRKAHPQRVKFYRQQRILRLKADPALAEAQRQRARLWRQAHPEARQLELDRRRERRQRYLEESLAAWRVSPYKTPMAAIRGYCHACGHGTTPASAHPKSYVVCLKLDCPLFPFRNGSPTMTRRNSRSTEDMRAARAAIRRGSAK